MFTIKLEDFDIEKIAESGQCFRMNRMPQNGVYEEWSVIACNMHTVVQKAPFSNEYTVKCPFQDNMFWAYYFDLLTDYAGYRAKVDENDALLTAATDFGKGIRILRQNPWEMLISFIISQRKSIPAIKTCIEKICSKFGDPIGDGLYAFPTASQLAQATMEDLQACGLGYRAEYIYLASRDVASGKIDLLSYDNLSDEDLLKELMKIKGVGVKVANCVSLFGYYRIAAFPVDVWIDRVQQQFYMGHFPVDYYKGFAGIMQQYIFYFIRTK